MRNSAVRRADAEPRRRRGGCEFSFSRSHRKARLNGALDSVNALNCIVSRPGRYSMYAKSAEFGNSLNIIIALALLFATLYKLTIDRPKTTLRSKKDNSLG